MWLGPTLEEIFLGVTDDFIDQYHMSVILM